MSTGTQGVFMSTGTQGVFMSTGTQGVFMSTGTQGVFMSTGTQAHREHATWQVSCHVSCTHIASLRPHTQITPSGRSGRDLGESKTKWQATRDHGGAFTACGVQALVSELTKKHSACQGQLSTAQERCSQLDKEKQQAVSDLQTSRQVSVSHVFCACGWVYVGGRGIAA
jgi:hypothetical protein